LENLYARHAARILATKNTKITKRPRSTERGLFFDGITGSTGFFQGLENLTAAALAATPANLLKASRITDAL